MEVVDREDALSPLLDSWRQLAALRGNAFVTPEWYLIALKKLHAGAVPAVAVMRGPDGAVRGLLPLIDSRSPRGSRRLSFPATQLGDLFTPIAEPGREDELAAAVAPALAEHVGARCELDLGRVDAEATWWSKLAGAWPSPMTSVPQPADRLPYVELAGLSWEDYLATRSGQFRNQVRRKMSSLRRDHDVSLRRSADAAQVLADMATLFRLHDARWAERTGTSSITDPGVREFHSEFAVAAHGQGWLRLYLLEVDQVPVASWYGWRIGDRYSYYQAGFDPVWSRSSVGFLLLAETVREAIAEGATEYDLLLGDETFKARFATAERLGRSVVLAPPLSRRRLASSAEGIARAGVRAMPGPVRDRIRALRGRRGG